MLMDQINQQAPDLLRPRHHPDEAQPEPRDEENDGHEHDGDQDRPRQEFPVDDRVPVNRLGNEFAQGPGASFPVDGVKAQDDPDERPEEGDKGNEGKQLPGGKKHQEDERRFGDILQFIPQGGPHHVRHDQADDQNQGEEQDEAGAAEMVCQLFPADGPDSGHDWPSLKYFM